MKKIYIFLLAVIFMTGCSRSTPTPLTNQIDEPPRVRDRELSDNAKRLFNYLSDQYGNYIISGQMDTAWTTNAHMDMIARVYTDTGKYPALKGFDLLDLPHSWGGFGQDQIDEAIEWWEGKNNGVQLLPDSPHIRGIVSFCWHWRRPDEFYTDRTTFRIPWKDGKLDTESIPFQRILSDLDKAAALLEQLKERDIPVLWRPLHEAAGNWRKYGNTGNAGAWFWWGASGPEPYIALWEFMYDYFTFEKNLNNLIWVWNGQHAEWYPSPDTVDIVGYDVYPPDTRTQRAAQNYSSWVDKFNEALNMVPERNRMIALSENGAIPDPDNCKNDNAMWSWFMTWNDGYGSQQGDTHRDNFWTGEWHNTNEHKMHVYHHPLVITLDELPDLTEYRLE